MKGFNFEKNLPHQETAVQSSLSVFEGLQTHPIAEADKQYINPIFNQIEKQGNVWDNRLLPEGRYYRNIAAIQTANHIQEPPKSKSTILDIMMETGTGKTYTYAKTIFELNKQYDIFKFIVVVPTLSIKAGTIDFLKSESSRAHFKEQYNKTLRLHVVESQKSSKSKKSFIPPAITSFVNAGNFDKTSIQVLIINAGMLNSETLQKSFDKGLFDRYTVPLEALAAVKPFVIIDEPHKFSESNKAWENLQKMRPQFILRYGATFPEKEIERKNEFGKKEKIVVKDYHNLIYQLTAVDSFNRNLVKGIVGHIMQFDNGKNALVRLADTDGSEAAFELQEGDIARTIRLTKGESLAQLHGAMQGLLIEHLNKSTVLLSNGLELKKGDKLNPYSYHSTLQETMVQEAIRRHFELEKQLLTRSIKIKPLTLFFIDNIEEYRSKEGALRRYVEQCARATIETLLEEESDPFFKAYLEKSLLDISAIHAGYFSKDNTEKDEAIEKEIHEILHDKQALLDLANPRRFIFSKWTLREGWDNPNVFQICKLRSSGSDISKLQEVGRGLRLPVNEYGNRVKDEPFYLNYFVDFTESDFIDKLVKEINQKSGAISIEEVPAVLSEQMIDKICEMYPINKEDLLTYLDNNNVINRSNAFKPNGFDFIKQQYPRIFEGVHSNKVRKATDAKKRVLVRTAKYAELKELWETLNERVVLEYKMEKEADFQQLFTDFLQKQTFTPEGIHDRTARLEIKDQQATVQESESLYNRTRVSVATWRYSDFLKELSESLHIRLDTLHRAIVDSGVDINAYLNQATLRSIKQQFDYYLMTQAMGKFSIEYKKVSNVLHPTKLTNARGEVLSEIAASDIGVLYSDESVAHSYFFDELYYDSELERLNIRTEIEEVLVFTKIPKNSIKIPVAGGKSYSPDFAYVVKRKDGSQKLHFVVETKDVNTAEHLREEEQSKIKHAEKFFGGKMKIEFRTQFSGDKIARLIKDIMG